MRRTGLIVLVLLILAGGVLWFVGAFDALARWAMVEQREAQTALARAINALRAGHPGALAALLSLTFAYGFFHAAGPGHGKVLIASYGIGRQVPLKRLLLVALASSLGQAVTAIVLVYGTLWLLGWGREELTAFGDVTLARLSAVMLALIGLWLLVRGIGHLRSLRPTAAPQPHGHALPHDHGPDCGPDCGHTHLPDATQIAKTSGFTETVVMIGVIAARPCTGALLLLLLTWQFGLIVAGLLGTLTMALGTASVVLVVALLAGGSGATLIRALDGRAARLAVPVVELAAGGVIIAAALIGWGMIRPF
jgi:nickel/cobalt transporter (NicO) family protein